MEGPSEFINEWNNGNEYIIAHTSGSTGIPKEIRLPKPLMKESALRTLRFFNLKAGSRFHVPLSFDYIAAKMMVVRSILCNGVLTWEFPSNRILTNQPHNAIDLLAVVPSQLVELLARPEIHKYIANMIVGGSGIPFELRMQLTESSINAFETYGMTETASHIALRQVTTDIDLPFEVLDGISISIDKDSCLRIDMGRGPVLKTNDIVEIIDSGHFRLLGRIDNAIISGGIKVHPLTVENKIEPLFRQYTTNVPAFYITSRKHKKWGEQTILAVEDSVASRSLHNCFSEFMEKCKEILNPAEIPADLVIETEFQRTTSGKIIRRKY